MLYIDVIRPSLEILTLCTANFLFLSLSNLPFFVTIKTQTHIGALCSVEDNALLYKSEGREFGALCVK
jgi:hypothetical protein